MRTLILSDIHANLPALEAVITDAGHVDRTWCLGDLVGYGPEPNECIELINQQPGLSCVLGNHDSAVVEKININTFNGDAKVALIWQKKMLGNTNKKFLMSLNEVEFINNVMLVHGSPRNPVWEYILNSEIARKNFKILQSEMCLTGHSHIPGIFTLQIDQSIEFQQPRSRWSGDISCKHILNPGSVGQPRDRDSRASYVIFDDEDQSWHFHRVEYDISKVQHRIIESGLPFSLAHRLSLGF